MTEDISFSCPGCGQPLDADPDMAGMETGCPACGGTLTVPGRRRLRLKRTAASPERPSAGRKGGLQFRYAAVNAQGEEVEGVVMAGSRDDAVKRIRGSGLFPTRILPEGPSRQAASSPPHAQQQGGSRMRRLVQCRTCGAEIARDADSCPHCGAKTPTHYTAQIVMAVAVIIAVIAGVMEFLSRTR